MSKTRLGATVSALALLVSGTGAWAQEVQVPPAGEATTATGTPYPDDQVPVTTPVQPEEAEGEEIVVTGLRRSLQSAQSIKRNSDSIVDAIVAEDIGKLPDVTVAETAARIPGIQVERARGEAGGFVRLRGLPDVTTTYNSREIFTAEVRSVALGDFPAGGIAAIETYKSTTANLIEGGLGGLINVRARRPFDFKGLEIAGSVRGTYATQSGEIDPNGNLLISNRWETGIGDVGALVNFSYQSLRYLDSARWNTGFIGTARTTDTKTEFRFPDQVGIFYGAGDRERPSINGALQWRPSPDLEFYVDGLWQGYREKFVDRALIVPLWGGANYTNLDLRPGTNQAQSLTVSYPQPGCTIDPPRGIFRPCPDLFQGATKRRTDTFQFAVGGSYDAGPVRISADAARTDSQFDFSTYSFDTAFASSPTIDVNFDVPRGPGGVEFSFRNFDTTNPANFVYRGLFEHDFLAAGDDWQFRTDLEWDTGFSFLPEVQVGLRHNNRDARLESGLRYSQMNRGRPLSAIPLDFQIFRPGFQGSSIQPVRTWITPTFGSLRENIAQLRPIAGFPEGPPPRITEFTANEKSYAAYAQIRYDLAEAGIPFDGTVGLRAVKTEFEIDTPGPTPGQIVTGEGEYTDYLPSFNGRLRFTDRLQLRLAATQTRTRPNFRDFGATILNSEPSCFAALRALPAERRNEIPPEQCNRSGRGGNPDLRPILSDNYEASLEYYFSRTGFASVALFRRDVTGFINRLTVRRPDPELGPDRIFLNIPINAQEGRLQGFEGNFQTFFDFLPGWLSGFGTQANVTYIDHEQSFAANPDAEDDVTIARIPGVSKWTYNLVGMYEQGGFSARLAYNYRSRRIRFYDAATTGVLTGEYVAPTSRLDWSSSYTPFENLTIEFNVANILGKPFRDFREFTPEGDRYPRDVRYEETVYSIGLRFRL